MLGVDRRHTTAIPLLPSLAGALHASQVGLLEPVMPGALGAGPFGLRSSLSAPAASLATDAKAWTAASQHAMAEPGQHAEGQEEGSDGWLPARPNRVWGMKKMLGKHQ